jgi:hypothetical protein
LSGPPNPSNLKAIEYYGNTRVLAQLPQLKQISTETLLSINLPKDLRKTLDT